MSTPSAPGTKPATELAKDRYLEKQATGGLLPPYKGEVEKHLTAMPRYAAGIRQLYAKYGIDKLPGAPLRSMRSTRNSRPTPTGFARRSCPRRAATTGCHPSSTPTTSRTSASIFRRRS